MPPGDPIWRLAPDPGPTSSFNDRGDALADAVEKGQQNPARLPAAALW